MSAKAALRAEMIAKRDALRPSERARVAAELTAALLALPQYAAARSVLATMSIGSEWSTRAFLEAARADGKVVVLPRICASPRRLVLHAVRDLDGDLVPGVWDIPEPDPARCPEVAIGDVDFAVVPALAADRAGFRLGYGAGFFDRLLGAGDSRPYCVAALPSAFMLESLPHEPHDVAVNLVIDEAGPLSRSRP
jgi:5-formyltetrahydrofolate cyclo-ligase